MIAQKGAKNGGKTSSSSKDALKGLEKGSSKKKKIILIVVFSIVAVLIILGVVGYSLGWFSAEEVEPEPEVEKTEGYFTEIDTSEEQEGPVSPLSGVACETHNRRPFGVMMASDTATRSYSAGFWDADLVVEQKASSGAGIPRLMAVFICGSPEEAGSIRSAREQYIPFAQAFDAVVVHWGGEHNVHEYLKTHVWDNINALGRGAGTAFYRRPEIPKPHNGFASTEGVMKAMKELGFRLESDLEPYPHQPAPSESERGEAGTLYIPYGGANAVTYTYDPSRNVYERTWGSSKHIDVNTDEQIAPVNVIVMFAESEAWYGQYNRVHVEGLDGDAEFYFNGKMEEGSWKHTAEDDPDGAKLEFLNENGDPIEFVPGQIWINVVDPEDEVKWEEKE